MTAHINTMTDLHHALALGGGIGVQGVTDIVGAPGDESLIGTAGKDNFDLSGGGEDTASGGRRPRRGPLALARSDPSSLLVPCR